MEQYNNKREDNIEKVYDYTKGFINNYGAIIFIFIAVIAILLAGSLSGFKEIKAKKSDSSRLLNEWRQNNETLFPEEYIDVIKYDGKEYYFIIDKVDSEGKIISWYFAYDSELAYVFKDSKFWILTGLTLSLSIFVYSMTSKSTLRKVQDSEGSKKARMAYAVQKNRIMDDVEYIDIFCEDEYNSIYERELRDIVNSVDLDYNVYKENISLYEIPKWYKIKKWRSMDEEQTIFYKKLRYVSKQRKKINIQKLRGQDLIQENDKNNTKKIVLLSDGAQQFLNKKIRRKIITQSAMTLLSGLTVTFGIALGDWTVGISYAFTIVSAGISGIIVTTDYARTTLRQRDIVKANYLKKFENKIPYYKEKEKQRSEEDELTRNIEEISTESGLESEQRRPIVESRRHQEHGQYGNDKSVI